MTIKNTLNNRIEWVEYAKGIAVFIVILRHVLGGLVTSGMVINDIALNIHYFYLDFSFELHVFFVLSGLFLLRSVQKSAQHFIRDRLYRIVYPYVIWSLITYAIALLLANYTNGEVISSVNDILYLLLIDPQNRFWFLYVLFILVMLFATFSYFKLPTYTFFGFAIVSYVITLTIYVPPIVIWAKVLYYMIFLALGIQFSKQILDFTATRTSLQFATGALLGLGVWLINFWTGDLFNMSFVKDIFILSAVIGTFSLSALLDRLKLADFIRILGKYSLELYVAHGLAVSGIRIILSNLFGIKVFAIHIVLGIVAGIVFPFAVAYVSHLLNFKYAFTIPGPAKTKPS